MSDFLEGLFNELKDNKEFIENMANIPEGVEISFDRESLCLLLMKFAERLDFNIMFSEMSVKHPELIEEKPLDGLVNGTTALYTTAWIAREEFDKRRT